MNIGKRIELSKEPYGIVVSIKTSKSNPLLYFMPVLLTLWTLGLVAAMIGVFTGANDRGLMIYGLCVLLFAEVLFTFGCLWMAFGREIVSINRGMFEYRREIFGRAVTKKAARISELSNLRAVEPFGPAPSSKGDALKDWGFTGGVIAVDQSWDTHKFGAGLEEEEAVALVAELRPYLPEKSDNSFNRS